MRVIADLHVHSRYSRACSKELTLPNIAAACAVRGIDWCVTGDFTHPQWREEIGRELREVGDGVFALRDVRGASPYSDQDGIAARSDHRRGAPHFLLGTELSCIAKHAGATRRVHHLVLAPSLAAVDRLTAALEARGCNLRADGRPILGLTSKQLLELCLMADERMLVIPAHAWTPWFAVFGSESGYDALTECFEDLTPHVLAIETGLSSDPLMNWRCSWLDTVALVSSSDAHSIEKLGREATVLELASLSFASLTDALRNAAPVRYRASNANRVVETIEFFPAEGKYHHDGHRVCGVRCAPQETKKHAATCPQCKKPMTIGVLSRVDKLADREEGFRPPHAPTFRSTVPLREVIAEACGVRSVTSRVRAQYDVLTRAVGSEFFVLLDAPLEVIACSASPELVEAIRRVRVGALTIAPGFDGTFGTVRIFTDEHPRPIATQHVLL